MYRRVLSAAVCTALFTFAGLGASSAKGLNTYNDWNGSDNVFSFGCGGTATYGQVITVPNTSTLTDFSFWWANHTSGSMVVRGEVYAWDGSKATGSALWESKKTTISYSDNTFHKQTFSTGVLPLTPGAQYVLFASVTKDYALCTSNDALMWGSVDDKSYRGGTFVYLNNGSDKTQWTKMPWITTYGVDTAFIASFN